MNPRTALAPLALGLSLTACVSDQGTLSRLEDAYALETSQAMASPLRSTIALGALSVDACVALQDGSWAELVAGEPLPIGDEVAEVLGQPMIESLSVGTPTTMALTGLPLLDEEDARLVLTLVAGAPIQFSGGISDVEGNQLGEVSFEVASDCSDDWGRISGTAQWSHGEIDHNLTLPADGSGSAGLDWWGTVPWLPRAGVLGWQGRMDGELRNFTSQDAENIEPNGSGGNWPGVINGLEWSTTGTVELQP